MPTTAGRFAAIPLHANIDVSVTLWSRDTWFRRNPADDPMHGLRYPSIILQTHQVVMRLRRTPRAPAEVWVWVAGFH
jgi:hypothetical protein